MQNAKAKTTRKRTRKTTNIGRDPQTGRFVSPKNLRPGDKSERVRRVPRGPGKKKGTDNGNL